MTLNLILSFLLWHLLLLAAGPSSPTPTHAAAGQWTFLNPNIGISAMHMQLLNNDRVVIYDRTDFGRSNISLPNGKCRIDPNDTALTTDCTAHSVEYDVATNSIRPLMVLTDVWCSSGALMSDGRLIQTGGFNDGDRVVRVYRPCTGCDWEEIKSGLTQRRWYATNHILPDGRQIVIGGRRQFNYEFYPKIAGATTAYNLPFLVQTNDPKIENNLYPFVFLNVDGNLFIFANNRAILFDYLKDVVVKTYPEIPGGDPRTYPSTGSSVLLPLKNLQGLAMEAEVLVCGGAPKGSYTSAVNGNFVGALNTCGRIKITDPSPQWVMETMPLARVMGDMVLLPTGDVLIINGGSAGTAGWEYGRNPVFQPVIYRPNSPIGSRFEVQNPTTIPRMYHSTAILLRDGRVLIGGSNPHITYNFVGVLFPTELSLEAFSPSYLDSTVVDLRPKIVLPVSQTKLRYGQRIAIRFTVIVGVMAPGSSILAPAGYYLLFVVHQDIPSEGIWVQIQ
ncbi:hypothetical protein F0562_036070 [Nyssa sinensis]|uniref:Aldehyde oxidase GLOX n=1 Tax=Nyssa sinensis TaxID=561372 RepID=A0A5J5ACF8_9ASTE|nr:hypothetical protein F0562_036070 [Nyssa sinensis]